MSVIVPIQSILLLLTSALVWVKHCEAARARERCDKALEGWEKCLKDYNGFIAKVNKLGDEM
jgi:hypothetical protein